ARWSTSMRIGVGSFIPAAPFQAVASRASRRSSVGSDPTHKQTLPLGGVCVNRTGVVHHIRDQFPFYVVSDKHYHAATNRRRLVVYFQRHLGLFAQFCFKFFIWISVDFLLVDIIQHDWLFTTVGHIQSTDVGPMLLNCTIILITHRPLQSGSYGSARLTRRDKPVEARCIAPSPSRVCRLRTRPASGHPNLTEMHSFAVTGP